MEMLAGAQGAGRTGFGHLERFSGASDETLRQPPRTRERARASCGGIPRGVKGWGQTGSPRGPRPDLGARVPLARAARWAGG